MLLAQRLSWERVRWVLLLLFAHLLFGARAGLYDETKSLRSLRRYLDLEQLGTPLGMVSAVCLVGAVGLLILFLLTEDD